MKKRLASLMLAMALMLAGNAGVTASAVEIRDLKRESNRLINAVG